MSKQVITTTPICEKCNKRHGGFRVTRDRSFVHFNCEERQPDDLYFWWDLTAGYHPADSGRIAYPKQEEGA